jgi:hypothetical protein
LSSFGQRERQTCEDVGVIFGETKYIELILGKAQKRRRDIDVLRQYFEQKLRAFIESFKQREQQAYLLCSAILVHLDGVK